MSTNFWSERHLTRVLKNKHQAVSQGVRRFGKRSPPAADEHLQKPHNAGSRREARFFNRVGLWPRGGRLAIRHRATAVRITATAAPKNTQSLPPVVKSGSVRVSE